MTRPVGSFNVSHECALDAKWIVIGRATGALPSFVAGVWLSLMTHASAQFPRGSTAGFDTEALAVFNGCEIELVDAVVAQFRARNLIDESGRLRAWSKRQGLKSDRTNANRQKRYRDRQRDQRNGGQDTQPDRNVTPVTRNARRITPSNERYEKGGDMGGVALPTSSVTEKLNTPNKRSVAHALAREEIIEELEREKAGGKLGWKVWNSGRLDQLAAAKVTGAELHTAIAMAKARRQADGSRQPINTGLVAAMVDEIRTRTSSPNSRTRQVAGHSPAAPPDDPVLTAIQQARHMHSLGAIDEAERDRRIAAARARRGGEVTA